MALIRGIAVHFRSGARGFPEYSEDVELLADSIESILKTVPGERVRRPTFGSYLRKLLFTNMSRAAALRARTEARRSIESWEKRVVVDEILTKQIDNRIELTVLWRPNGNRDQQVSSILEFGA